MNSSNDRLDRIEAILAATAIQTQANTTAIDRLTDRIDRLTDRVESVVVAVQSHQEALRLIQQQQHEWLDQMRITQVEIRDIWQYLNNQLRNRGNGGSNN